uniref:uS11m n=1 Tax=Trypanosoma brucei brucei TaxID=5702 RepID=UPI00122C135F|nr:Chain CK, uS11m [Trypanosoma brucei brucei]6SGA_CK Chain CK, uS11m [Trypanosoma brucei brucei]6SGB_CK Chain CK, uS11m [Trypanosoma brucei brucei]
MMRKSVTFLRRGKPRPRAGMFPDKYRRVPMLLKPQQGGQQYFNHFLIRSTNDRLTQQDVDNASGQAHSFISPQLPQMDWRNMSARSSEESIREEMRQLAENDVMQHQRVFNERMWYEKEEEHRMKARSCPEETSEHAISNDGAVPPPRVLGGDYFKTRFGYSLVKNSEMTQGPVDYSQLDMWGEMPRYTSDMVFLYLVSRRRNTYAVAYTYEGKRILNTYTAGNRGLKGGDRGFRSEGSTDNGHQVTSMYLNDLLPKLREMRASEGRPMGRGEKVELVVRVMGFYNGRQGAVRAVQDRANEFHVRYFEDITPFPLNGPKMPRGVFK